MPVICACSNAFRSCTRSRQQKLEVVLLSTRSSSLSRLRVGTAARRRREQRRGPAAFERPPPRAGEQWARARASERGPPPARSSDAPALRGRCGAFAAPGAGERQLRGAGPLRCHAGATELEPGRRWSRARRRRSGSTARSKIWQGLRPREYPWAGSLCRLRHRDAPPPPAPGIRASHSA